MPAGRAQGESRLGIWLTHHLGFDSIRGRYLLVAGFFVVSMLAAGWAAQKIVDQTARQSSVNLTEREQVGRLLNELSNDIWLTETALQSFLLSPGKQQRTTTLATIDHLIADTGIYPSPLARLLLGDKLQRLADIQELRQSDRLMEIRANGNAVSRSAPCSTRCTNQHPLTYPRSWTKHVSGAAPSRRN
jgi:hypothetical protein